jgi:hypothetical protein
VKRFFTVVAFILVMLVPMPGTSQEPPPPADSEFVFARVQFTQRRWTQYWRELRDDPESPGPPWWHDWPFSDTFVTSMLKETTGLKTDSNSHQNVELESPEIFKYPFLYFPNRDFFSSTTRKSEPWGIHPAWRIHHGG